MDVNLNIQGDFLFALILDWKTKLNWLLINSDQATKTEYM